MSIASMLLLMLALNGPADLVIENARIWSDGLTGFAPFAAVENGRFTYVGPRDALWIGPETEIVNAEGRVVIPGLIDSHIHMMNGGLLLGELQLREATSRADFIQRVADWTRALPDGAWVRGGRWSTESWADPTQPTKEWIDEAAGDHPVYLPRMDGHSALVNSVALEMAGITANSPPDPEGGVIDRDPETGEPTGILRESAMSLIETPAPSEAEKLAALKRAMMEMQQYGITAVADIPIVDDLAVYQQLADQRELTARFYLYPTADNWQHAVSDMSGFRNVPHWMQINGLKTYLDGSLGSRTAYMHEPFLGNESHQPEWRGLLREGVTGGHLRSKFKAAREANLQPIAHAIGDEANHLLLNTLEDVFPDVRSARARSEHTQHLLPADIARFGTLGVIASMQPYHKADDGRYAESYLGPARIESSYAWKSLLDAGAVVVFGSDWPVVTANPFLGIETAVTGRIMTGAIWQPHENLTVGESLRCYTSRAAFAIGAEHEIGRIAPGFRADFVILDRSPFDPDVEWSAIRPVAVYVEGQRVPNTMD